MDRRTLLAAGLILIAMLSGVYAQSDSDPKPRRAARGLAVLYDFGDESGEIKDRTGNGGDLVITEPGNVRRSRGKLKITGQTRIHTRNAPEKLISSIRRSGELTMEAWLKPANDSQTGPARIVTLSKDSNNRNFTLGQDGNRFDTRLRATNTTANGLPSVQSPAESVKTERLHVVYRRKTNGKARLFLNGKPSTEADVGGNFSSWDDGFRLGLANEIEADRQWLGTLYLVAIYHRALGDGEIKRNYEAGHRAALDSPAVDARKVVAKIDPAERHFETHIAPIFARHCLECHDASTHQGGLVLSHKAQAFAGGDSGIAIAAGKSADSLLWESVESDEMPHDRAPLSGDEKKLLKDWIDSGATWSLNTIDAAIYANLDTSGQRFVRRLTVEEYIETVRATVGVDISEQAHELLPPDLRADGFSNTAYNLNVDLRHVEAFAQLSEIIVEKMDVAKFADRFGKNRDFTDDVMRPLISRIGRRLLRGPLSDDETTSLRGITTTAAAASRSVDNAIGLVIQSLLQSPRFVYRIEDQRSDDNRHVDEFELASRLSYLIWGGPPDEALLEAAEDGDLGPAGCRDQVTRMLKDPRAHAQAKRFVADWLDLDRLSNMRPNADRFPEWDSQLGADMRAETLAFFEQVAIKEGRPLADLLNAQVTFATPRLARHYGMTPGYQPANQRPSNLLPTAYDVSDIPERGGLLTQGSLLTIGGDDASMVTRGLFVMHELLRGVVKDPPPGVDTTPKPSKKGLTNRTIAMERIENETCGGCHAKFEPLAFGLEKFDGIGRFKEKDEHGNTQREDGKILFPLEADPITYDSVGELMDSLAGSERVKKSLTWKVTQFAMGRPLGASDARTMARIHEESTKNGGTYASVITAIAMSDLIQER